MALKDLVATKSALAEEAIESIVRGLVTYDEEMREVVLTPDGLRLGNRSKTLVYLTALLGWPFITSEATPTDAKPAEIESATGIPGGSLRPMLKDLLEAHLLSYRDGRYSVRSTSFAAIAAELSSPGSAPTRKRRRAGSKSIAQKS